MRARRVDANQKEIVKALIAIGCTVADTSRAGEGFPDLVVGYRKVNYMIEVKDGEKVASRKQLTPAQVKFHADWKGQIVVVESVEQAINAVSGFSVF